VVFEGEHYPITTSIGLVPVTRAGESAGAMIEMLAQCKDFGAWTRQQAQNWWAENRSTLPVEEHEDTHSPLSDTQMLIDPGD
jgi:hypothetical protein